MSWKDDMRVRVDELHSGDKFVPADGLNTFRILPSFHDLREVKMKDGSTGLDIYRDPKRDPHSPIAEYRMHYGVGPGKAHLRCGKDIKGRGKCWLCGGDTAAEPGMLATLLKGTDQKKALAFEIGPKNCITCLVSVVNQNTKKFGKPQSWKIPGAGIPGRAAPDALSTRICELLIMGDFSFEDPRLGHNLSVVKTKQGDWDRYGALLPDPKVTVVPQDVLRAIRTLQEFFPEYDPEKMQRAFYEDLRKPSQGQQQSGPRRQAAPYTEPTEEYQDPQVEGVDDVQEDALPESTDSDESQDFPVDEGMDPDIPFDGDSVAADLDVPLDNDMPVDDDFIPEIPDEDLPPDAEPAPEPQRRQAPARPSAPRQATPPARQAPVRNAAPAPRAPAAKPPARPPAKRR